MTDNIDTARHLIEAGIPVFVAKRCKKDCPLHHGQGSVSGFDLPPRWQVTTPDVSVLDRWEKGDALAMLGGHGLDAIDVDPRNGGTEVGLPMPRVYAEAATPSGGKHYLVRSLGVGKVPDLVKGVDLQAGTGNRDRGFIFIAPTRRASKDPADNGRVRPYVWIKRFDPDEFTEWAEADDTGDVLRDLANARRAPAPRVLAVEGGDPFDNPLQPEAVRGEQRYYTVAEAKEFLRRPLDDLMNAQLGQVEERANAAATALSHFVPEFWDAGAAFGILRRAAGRALNGTWEDGRTGWTLAKFMPVLDGRRPPRDNWKATRREAEDLEAAVAEQVPSGRLRAHWLKRSELKQLPRPVPLIEGVLFDRTIAIIAGKFGTYKSFVSVAMACSLATGKDWLGYAVPEALPVMYIAAEGASGIQGRVEAWEAENGEVPDTFTLVYVPARLTDPGDMTELAEMVRESGARVVFWDTLHRNAPGVDENSASEMGGIITVLDNLRETTGITSVLPHHTGHSGERSRGSSSIEDDADTAFVIRLADSEDRSEYNQRTLVHRKTKDGELLPETQLCLSKHPEIGSAVITVGSAPIRDEDEFMIGSLMLRMWKERLDTVSDGQTGLDITSRDESKDTLSKRLKDRYPEMSWRKEDLLKAVKRWREDAGSGE